MSLGESIRIARQKAFYNQEDFARKLCVAASTVNRWELNKVRPNVKAMKAIKLFCEENDVDFREIETQWLYHSEKAIKATGSPET